MIGFGDFFQIAHPEREPYPWQERLAAECASGSPPRLVAVPTGAGKTATIDALVWALAAQADRPATERSIGVRIVWAIDRRILVDEVHEQASRLADILTAAHHDRTDPLHEMASRLARLSGEHPLIAVRWRGGLAERAAQAGPFQPAVITSTVAQIGSRLLFRGYGVAKGSRALAAGLAACDTTICLDEAHLAAPFAETVAAIRTMRAREAQLALPPLGLVELTATPASDDLACIRLEDSDRAALGQRLTGPKWARLDDAASSDGEKVTRLAEKTAGHLEGGARTVACVANTVKRARAVFDRLVRGLGDEVDCMLLIGPQRPADREAALANHGATLYGRVEPARPLVCVATQTFEVGLDADVAALVTESASASALVQRLGRLNRRGLGVGSADVVRDADSWLYGEDEELAWQWLDSRKRADGSIDVSVATLDSARNRPDPLHTAAAPSLTPETIELFAQTAPEPGPFQNPDPEPFLSGVEHASSSDVSVCWRCDLLPEIAGEEAGEYRKMLLELVPPHRRELLSLSLRSARALIAARFPAGRQAPKAMAEALADFDLEGGAAEGDVPGHGPGELACPFMVVRGDEVLPGSLVAVEERVRPMDLAAGDVIVLPAEAGGVDEFGIAPRASAMPESDVAPDQAPYEIGAAVRISPPALRVRAPDDWARIARACRRAERSLEQASGAEARRSILDDLVKDLSRYSPAITSLSTQELADSGSTIMLRSVGPAPANGMPLLETEELADEPDESLQEQRDSATAPSAVELERTWVLLCTRESARDETDRDDEQPPPTLVSHATAVRTVAENYADRLGLAFPVRESLLVAAAAHDHGKADPRIQSFYRRGAMPLGLEPIAKSEFGTRDPRTSRIAASLAGLPRALHHEIASVSVLAHAFEAGLYADRELDQELALHLVGTHHGRGRPIPSVPRGGAEPREFQVDALGISGHARGDGRDGWGDGAWLTRFWTVLDRYGPWGTAYLEGLLMLSDRAVSAKGG